MTAAGFAIAFTGKNSRCARRALVAGSLAAMAAVYATIVPHEEAFLRSQFGEEFERYCDRVPRIVPRLAPADQTAGAWDARAVTNAESKTFVTLRRHAARARAARRQGLEILAAMPVRRRLVVGARSDGRRRGARVLGRRSFAQLGADERRRARLHRRPRARARADRGHRLGAARPIRDARSATDASKCSARSSTARCCWWRRPPSCYEAVRRFAMPVEPGAALMTGVAAIGLAVNGGVGFMLHAGAKRDLNVRAALFHVFGDALGGAAVIVGGIAIAADARGLDRSAALVLRRGDHRRGRHPRACAMRPTSCSRASRATSTRGISSGTSKRSAA